MQTYFMTINTYLNRAASRLFLWRQKQLETFIYEQVLGTRLELSLNTKNHKASSILRQVLAEVERLEAVFSRFDASSELNHWLRAEGASMVSEDLAFLLRTSQNWIEQTGAAFHPGADAFSRLWQDAELRNALPSAEAMRALRNGLTQALIQENADYSIRNLSPLPLNFNAIAKGYIVDCASQKVAPLLDDVVLNLGGDLRHIGKSEILVEVADPFRQADNAKPALSLYIKNQAVATSGMSKRGYVIAGKRYAQLIDPRTGWPVEHLLSATVIASDCTTADVLATAFSIMSVEESLSLAEKLSVGCFLILASGETRSNSYLDHHRAA